MILSEASRAIRRLIDMSIIVIVAGVRVVIAGAGVGVVGGMRGRMAGGG